MSVDNLPAVRTSADVAVPAAPEAAAAPAVNPQSENFFLLAIFGGVLTGSAAWGHLWWQALGIGAGSVALGVAGVCNRRREAVTARVVAPMTADADVALIAPGHRGGSGRREHRNGGDMQPMTPTTPTSEINGK